MSEFSRTKIIALGLAVTLGTAACSSNEKTNPAPSPSSNVGNLACTAVMPNTWQPAPQQFLNQNVAGAMHITTDELQKDGQWGPATCNPAVLASEIGVPASPVLGNVSGKGNDCLAIGISTGSQTQAPVENQRYNNLLMICAVKPAV